MNYEDPSEYKYVYWEQQGKDRLCGLHTLNSLLQGPIFNESSLFSIAQELDRQEKEIMESAGMPIGEEGTNNIADDGNYNVQVLTKALENYANYEIERIDKKGVVPPSGSFCEEQGFICHSVDHWFAIRKVHDTWFNLNSTNMMPGPQIISDFYLDAFLAAVKEKGYTVFVIRGSPLPNPNKAEYGEGLRCNQHYMDFTVLKVHYENNKGQQLNSDGADQSEIERALKASIDDFSSKGQDVPRFNHDDYVYNPADFGEPVEDQDEELRKAIELSMLGQDQPMTDEKAPEEAKN